MKLTRKQVAQLRYALIRGMGDQHRCPRCSYPVCTGDITQRDLAEALAILERKKSRVK